MSTGRDKNFISIPVVCGAAVLLCGAFVSPDARAASTSSEDRIEVAQYDDTAFSHVTEWLERAHRTYQAEVAGKLSVPRAAGDVGKEGTADEAPGFWGRIWGAIDTAMGYLSFWLDRAYEAVGLPAPSLPYAPDSRLEREVRAAAEARQEAESEWKSLEERAEAVARDAAQEAQVSREAVQMATAGELPAVHLADAERARAEQRKAELAKRKQELDRQIADGLKKLEEFTDADEAGKQRIRDAARNAEEALKAAEDKLSEAKKAEEARRVAEAEAASQQAEDEARRAEEGRRKAEEAEASRKAEEEARRVAEARRQAEEAETARLAAEKEAAARKAEEERRIAEARRRTDEALKAQKAAETQVLADAAAARRTLEEARRLSAERRMAKAAETADNAEPVQTTEIAADERTQQEDASAATTPADAEETKPSERSSADTAAPDVAESQREIPAGSDVTSETHDATRVAAAATTEAAPRRVAIPRKRVRSKARSHRARASTRSAHRPRSALGCKWRKPSYAHKKRARTVKRREATLWPSSQRRVASRVSTRGARSVAPTRVKEARKRCTKRVPTSSRVVRSRT